MKNVKIIIKQLVQIVYFKAKIAHVVFVKLATQLRNSNVLLIIIQIQMIELMIRMNHIITKHSMNR